LKDLGGREILTLAPLAVLMLAIGLAPEAFLKPSRADLSSTLTVYHERLAEPPREGGAALREAAPAVDEEPIEEEEERKVAALAALEPAAAATALEVAR